MRLKLEPVTVGIIITIIGWFVISGASPIDRESLEQACTDQYSAYEFCSF